MTILDVTPDNCSTLSCAEASSPAEATLLFELFRCAFGGCEEAWARLRPLLEPLMRGWVGVQRHVDPEDVLQEAFLLFFRYAPHAQGLLDHGSPVPVLAYLRKATKTALLLQLRQQRWAQVCSLGSFPHAELPVVTPDFTLQVELRDVLEACSLCLYNDAERVIFDLYFRGDLRPREILQRHAGLFADIAEIQLIIQRLTRRFRKQTALSGASQPRLRSAGAYPAPRQTAELFLKN